MFGSIFRTLFGGSKQTSESQSQSKANSWNESQSWNEAYPWLRESYGGMAGTGTRANDFIGSLLGLGGGPEADDAFNRYKDSTGYQFMMDSGRDAVEGSAAGRRMLQSGSTLKALTAFGQGLGSQYFNNYLDKLGGLTGQGLAAGQLIGGAGGRSYGMGESEATSSSFSKGKGTSQEGMGDVIGKIIATIAASDPRLKYDIESVGELPITGLTIYDFKYLGSDVVRTGVMADEVAEQYPEFLGPTIDGYLTVNYPALLEYEGFLE